MVGQGYSSVIGRGQHERSVETEQTRRGKGVQLYARMWLV